MGAELFLLTFEIIISIIISKPITDEKLPRGYRAAAQSAATPAPGALFMCTGLDDDDADGIFKNMKNKSENQHFDNCDFLENKN